MIMFLFNLLHKSQKIKIPERKEHTRTHTMGFGGSFICWFIPEVGTTASPGPGQAIARDQELLQRFPWGYQGPKHLGHLLVLLQGCRQGAGSEMEQMRLEPIPVMDVATTGSGYKCYATAVALA